MADQWKPSTPEEDFEATDFENNEALRGEALRDTLAWSQTITEGEPYVVKDTPQELSPGTLRGMMEAQEET